jgi:hypothetical protein
MTTRQWRIEIGFYGQMRPKSTVFDWMQGFTYTWKKKEESLFDTLTIKH